MVQRATWQMKAQELRVYGLVQGVGFRPFVARLANSHNLTGLVRNESGAVYILVKGQPADLASFMTELEELKPHPAKFAQIEKREVPLEAISPGTFTILDSEEREEDLVFLPPDMAICPQCIKELKSKDNRRYEHPFISCMVCGPRYTIINKIPYDRDNTTMQEFKMCPECLKEYGNQTERRFHAQTISCHDCGPQLIFRPAQDSGLDRELRDSAALEKTVEALNEGKIIAIKGIGGYHLACSPYDHRTVQALRALKGREAKPFALLLPDLATIKKYCQVSVKEAEALESMEKPIVLLAKLEACQEREFAASVCQGSLEYGIFLPYTPLQILLTERTGPLVMTSANISGEPIIWEDERIFTIKHLNLAGILYNERKIRTGIDDSVIRCLDKEQQIIRRARGYAPMPILVNLTGSKNRGSRRTSPRVLACGGMLKNTFCLVKDGFAYLSQHLGDLSNARSLIEYRSNVERLGNLLGITPDIVCCDRHPDYPTTRYAQSISQNLVLVQHHHAHIASVLAEQGISEQVLGVAFDGTGYGDDGKVWGGEFLICSPAEYQRKGQLSYISMLGGDSSILECWKSAAAYLYAAGLEQLITDPSWPILRAAMVSEFQCVDSSSMGRLFDAVSSILGICQKASYEGEGAIRLEQAALAWLVTNKQTVKVLPYEISHRGGHYQLNPLPLISALGEGVLNGVEQGYLAASFQYTLAYATAELCRQICREQGLQTVVLSGGVFQNKLLLQHLISSLRKTGLRVFYNTKVPPNDGGISLGQALVTLSKS